MKKTVVITGCSSGLGRDLSERLARRGDRVYASMRGIDGKNREIARKLQAFADAEHLDLRVLELE